MGNLPYFLFCYTVTYTIKEMEMMELETSYSSPSPDSLDLSHSPTANSIHSVVRNSRHTTPNSIIDMDTTPNFDTTDEIKEETSSNPIIVVSPPSLLKSQKTKGRIQFAVLCWSFFLIGWSDGSTGPMLPRIQEVYHVGHRGH
jgi:hypothetical protein